MLHVAYAMISIGGLGTALLGIWYIAFAMIREAWPVKPDLPPTEPEVPPSLYDWLMACDKRGLTRLGKIANDTFGPDGWQRAGTDELYLYEQACIYVDCVNGVVNGTDTVESLYANTHERLLNYYESEIEKSHRSLYR
jgi:hypothetical protein